MNKLQARAINEELKNLGAHLIPNCPDYYATTNGEIWSTKRNKLKKLSLTPDSDGYFVVSVFNNGTKTTKKVHRLVAAAFYGESNLLVAHLDGNPQNNQITNLLYTTNAINQQHKVLHGRSTKGKKNPSAKLSEEIILKIKSCAKMRQIDIARQFGLSQSHVSRILRGLNWKDLSHEQVAG